jgi:hypothetical protein
VDAIFWLVIGLASAWLAYAVVAGERRGHTWAAATVIGIYLAVFGGVFFGLGQLWGLFLRDKLVDEFPSENTMLFIGLVIIAGLVVLALDLLGIIDIMGKLRESMDRADVGRGTPGSTGPGTPGSPGAG